MAPTFTFLAMFSAHLEIACMQLCHIYSNATLSVFNQILRQPAKSKTRNIDKKVLKTKKYQKSKRCHKPESGKKPNKSVKPILGLISSTSSNNLQNTRPESIAESRTDKSKEDTVHFSKQDKEL